MIRIVVSCVCKFVCLPCEEEKAGKVGDERKGVGKLLSPTALADLGGGAEGGTCPPPLQAGPGAKRLTSERERH